MSKNNLCCRIYPVVVILISTIISAGIAYFDGGAHEFRFLTHREEFFNFVGISLVIALLPIGLYYYLSDKEKYENSARPLSLLGFVPALLFLAFLLV